MSTTKVYPVIGGNAGITSIGQVTTAPQPYKISGAGAEYWSISLPQSIKEKFDQEYKDNIKKYLKEHVLKCDVVVKRVHNFNDTVLVEFEPVLEMLAR